MGEINIYEPFPFSRFCREFDRAADAGFRVDVEEDDEQYRIRADLPGVNRDNVSVNLENNALFIGAKLEASGGNLVHSERLSGEVKRVFQLPRRVNAEGIEASIDNGVLTVVVPKAKSDAGRKIEVR